MEREASSMPGRGNNIIAYYRNYIISDFYNFIISEYCNFRNIYFHKFYIAVFCKKEASAICYIVALPLPHQRGKFLFVCTKIQLAISFLCAQKHNLLFSSVPLAVAAYSTRSLLLSHLEGEEPPEPFPCAAVSDGEGSLIDARVGDRLPLREDLPFGAYNSPCCLEALCIIAYYRNYIISELQNNIII